MARRSRTRRYYKNPKPSKSSGLSDGAKVAIALAGVAVVGGIGYYLYQQSQASQTASGGTAGGNTNAPTVLGPGGSNVALPAADATGTTIDYATSTASGPSAALAANATYAGEV